MTTQRGGAGGASAEAELMARYCDGDRAAFDALYGAVAPKLLGFLLQLVGDRALAEDVMQDALIKLHEARALYVRGADPVPWIFTIARHAAFDELRRRRRARVRLVADESGAPPEQRADLQGDPEGARTETDPTGAAALAALDQLPAAQREALLLTKVEGLSQVEAAARAGTTPGAIKLRAHRAYVALRKLVRKS
ncbi:MAG: polymerase, sigma-24 subunit, subfamily [Myxococcales bacterium]|nr:polymerase, sigma-24 subunit, subfamily [Myxococcales bacterium]